jgi:hypothetical protein
MFTNQGRERCLGEDHFRGALDILGEKLSRTGERAKGKLEDLRFFSKGCEFETTLAQGRMTAFTPPRMCSVRCLAGRVWVTVEGQEKDYDLFAGGSATFRGPGKVVVNGASEEALVRIIVR